MSFGEHSTARIHRQRTTIEFYLSAFDKRPAFAARAETRVFKLLYDLERGAVVDDRKVYVARCNPGLVEGPGSCFGQTGGEEVAPVDDVVCRVGMALGDSEHLDRVTAGACRQLFARGHDGRSPVGLRSEEHTSELQ